MSLIYSYCVTNKKPDLPGRFYCVRHRGLYAVASIVSKEDFSEEGMKRNLADLAWLKAKGPGLEKISNLKMGMKNICTHELVVVAAKDIDYKKGRKTTPMRKLVVADHTGNFPLYLPIVRGRGVLPGDIIKLEKAYVDYYEYTGEVALSVMPRGKIIIMK